MESFPEVPVEDTNSEPTLEFYKDYLERILDYYINQLKQSKAMHLLPSNIQDIDEQTLLYLKKALERLNKENKK